MRPGPFTSHVAPVPRKLGSHQSTDAALSRQDSLADARNVVFSEPVLQIPRIGGQVALEPLQRAGAQTGSPVGVQERVEHRRVKEPCVHGGLAAHPRIVPPLERGAAKIGPRGA